MFSAKQFLVGCGMFVLAVSSAFGWGGGMYPAMLCKNCDISIISASHPATQPEEYEIISGVFYLPISEPQADDYQMKRCRLDVYYPKNRQSFATVVFFHGGSMKRGKKYIPEEFKNKGLAVVTVDYRLNP